MPIATLQERTTKEVAIHLSVPPHGRPTFEALAELLSRHRGDRRVFLELDVPGQGKAAARPLRSRGQRVKPSERMVTRSGAVVRIGIGRIAVSLVKHAERSFGKTSSDEHLCDLRALCGESETH